MSEATSRTLTALSISYRKNRTNDRLLFGSPRLEIRRSWRSKILAFEPGSIVGFELWRADHYGTQDWQIYICKTARPDEPITRVPSIEPGAIILLSAKGKTRSKRVLSLIDRLKNDVDGRLNDIPESHWRHYANQIQVGDVAQILGGDYGQN